MLRKDEEGEEVIDNEGDIYECSTQTRDKFVRQEIKVYQLSESQSDLIPVSRRAVVTKPIVQSPEKYTQSPSLHRFSLARLQRESSKTIPEFEQFSAGKRKKDVCVLAQPPSRLILSKLSSAHIRQFVSPFYKQLDLPHIVGPPITDIFKSDLKHQSERFNDILSNSHSNCVQTHPKYFKKKVEFPKIDSPVVRYEMPRSPKKMKKIDRIVARLSTPTQSTRAKKTPKKDSPEENEISKPAECKHCHLKNVQFEKKDPNYDELQDFLDNIQPLID